MNEWQESVKQRAWSDGGSRHYTSRGCAGQLVGNERRHSQRYSAQAHTILAQRDAEGEARQGIERRGRIQCQRAERESPAPRINCSCRPRSRPAGDGG